MASKGNFAMGILRLEFCFSDRVEYTVGKGEIACSEQFLLFPQSFQIQ